MTRTLFGLLALCIGCSAYAVAGQPSIAIIIDDIGYQFEHDRAAMTLPGPLTFAILPHTPGVKEALKIVKARGYEVMLHLPMQSSGYQHRLAPGTLTRDMDWATFIRTVQSDLASVPGAIAVNNHEGSWLTADTERMHWLMQELTRHQNMVFIDSRTTRHTVALKTARYYGLPAARRDVFLDHEPGHIEEQFKELVRRARDKGTALGIAHPHPETVAFLRQNLPELEKQGIKLVKLSRMMQLQRKVIARN